MSDKRILEKVIRMRKEYDIKKLNPKKNPYSKRSEKHVNINIASSVEEGLRINVLTDQKQCDSMKLEKGTADRRLIQVN